MLSMIPQMMALYTESRMRWKMERMVSTVKVSWLQEAQFGVSLIARFEVLFSNVTVTLFLGIKIFKLVLSSGMLWDLTVRNLFTSTGIQLNCCRTFLETTCKGDIPCVFASPGAEDSWGEEGLDRLLLVLSTFVLPSRQTTQFRGLFVSSDQSISRMSVIWDWCVSDELLFLAASHTVLQNSS